MNSRVISFSKSYNTRKILSLITMDQLGIRIPETVLVNSLDIDKINLFSESIRNELKGNVYYLRACFSDNKYPHYISEYVEKDTLQQDIIGFLSRIKELNIKNYDLICQPLLNNVKYSGAVLKNNGDILLEAVFGIGMTLFRHGQFLKRLLRTNSEIYTQNGNQREVYKIINRKVLKEERSALYIDIEQIFELLDCDKLIDRKIYEFGIDDNQVFYFEYKDITPNSYLGLEKMITFNEYNVYTNSNRYLQDIKKVYDEPLFSYIQELNGNESKVKIRSGPILAHLPYYLTQNNITCIYQCDRESIIKKSNEVFK